MVDDRLRWRLKRWSDDVLLIEFLGVVEMDTAVHFRAQLLAVVRRRPRAIALDLSHVEYMDSSGVAVLIEALRWCRTDKVRLLLVNPSAAVTRANQVVHLASAFETVDDRDAAWAAFVSEDLLAKE